MRRCGLLLLPLLILLAACDPTDPPVQPDEFGFTPPQESSSTLMLPAGSTLDPASLTASTADGDFSVGSDGTFTVNVVSNEPSLVTIRNAAGNAILAGFLSPDSAKQNGVIDARSTAQVLLYFALGTFLTPPDQRDHLLTLIDGLPECATLAAAIDAAVAGNPTAFHDADAALVAALEAAHESVLASAEAGALLPTQFAAKGEPEATQILLQPDANTRQSGAQVLHNPDGSGVIVQNNVRRRASLFAYKTATVDTEGTRTDLSPPVQVGPKVEVPTTFRLEIVSSIQAALSGSAPWAPLQSAPLTLPRDTGTNQTIYELVLLGSSLNAFSSPPILSDPRFFSFTSQWSDEIGDLGAATFFFDFALPVIELVAVGATAQISPARQAATLEQFRNTLDPVLLARGIPLPLADAPAFRNAILTILEELGTDNLLSEAFIATLVNAWGPISAAQVDLENLENNLAAARKAGAILTAINLALQGLDLGAVLTDLANANTADSWSATVIGRRVNLSPSNAAISEQFPSVDLFATVNGLPNESFCFRWSINGSPGQLFTPLQDVIMDGGSFVTNENVATFLVPPPLIVNGALATVKVEVYLGTDCTGTPNPADFIGEATVTVMGEDFEDPCENDTFDPSIYQVNARAVSLAVSPAVVLPGGSLTITVTLDYSVAGEDFENEHVGVWIPYLNSLRQDDIIIDGGNGTANVDKFAAGTFELTQDQPRVFLTSPIRISPLFRNDGEPVVVTHTIEVRIPQNMPAFCPIFTVDRGEVVRTGLFVLVDQEYGETLAEFSVFRPNKGSSCFPSGVGARRSTYLQFSRSSCFPTEIGARHQPARRKAPAPYRAN